MSCEVIVEDNNIELIVESQSTEVIQEPSTTELVVESQSTEVIQEPLQQDILIVATGANSALIKRTIDHIITIRDDCVLLMRNPIFTINGQLVIEPEGEALML